MNHTVNRASLLTDAPDRVFDIREFSNIAAVVCRENSLLSTFPQSGIDFNGLLRVAPGLNGIFAAGRCFLHDASPNTAAVMRHLADKFIAEMRDRGCAEQMQFQVIFLCQSHCNHGCDASASAGNNPRSTARNALRRSGTNQRRGNSLHAESFRFWSARRRPERDLHVIGRNSQFLQHTAADVLRRHAAGHIDHFHRRRPESPHPGLDQHRFHQPADRFDGSHVPATESVVTT